MKTPVKVEFHTRGRAAIYLSLKQLNTLLAGLDSAAEAAAYSGTDVYSDIQPLHSEIERAVSDARRGRRKLQRALRKIMKARGE